MVHSCERILLNTFEIHHSLYRSLTLLAAVSTAARLLQTANRTRLRRAATSSSL